MTPQATLFDAPPELGTHRKGDRRRAGYGEAQRFVLEVAASDSDQCIEWPFFKQVDGYGRMKYQGRQTSVTRVVLELTGRPQPRGQIALHSCDNPPCVNPRHLRWGTDAENAADRDARGRHVTQRGSDNPVARLTEADVVDIRAAAASGETMTSLASRFGVSRQNVSLIVHRQAWRHVG